MIGITTNTNGASSSGASLSSDSDSSSASSASLFPSFSETLLVPELFACGLSGVVVTARCNVSEWCATTEDESGKSDGVDANRGREVSDEGTFVFEIESPRLAGCSTGGTSFLTVALVSVTA